MGESSHKEIIQYTTRCFKFGILPTKKKTIGKKRKMQAEIVDTIHILGLQKFDNYLRLNPIEITIASNSIKEALSSYRKYKFGFMVESLRFSTNVQSDTEIIFIMCDGLTN